MSRTQHTITAAELNSIIDDPQRGVVSLVGDHGGLSLVTGDVEPSNIVPGTLVIETEHGVVRFEPDAKITISEDDGTELSSNSLSLVDAALSGLLERLGWSKRDEGCNAVENEALNELTYSVGALVDDFLAAHRRNATTAAAAPDEDKG